MFHYLVNICMTCHAYLSLIFSLSLSMWFLLSILDNFLCKPSSDFTHPWSFLTTKCTQILSLLSAYDWSFLFTVLESLLFTLMSLPSTLSFSSLFFLLLFFLFYPSFPLFILSLSYFILISLILFHSFPVGKWGAARVHVWTGTHIGVVALLGLNSLAPVVMWTFSHLPPWQHQLPCSPPSNSIRKMGKAPLNASVAGEVHSRDRQHVKYWDIKQLH